MRSRFAAKTWIFVAQLCIFGGFSVFGLALGPLFWTGVLKDAHQEPRPQAGPPLTIVGMAMLALAALALFNLIARSGPLVRCCREGVECKIIGATTLDGVPMLPGLFRVAWTILSLQGFRSEVVRFPWEGFIGCQIAGVPMMYTITFCGAGFYLKTGKVAGFISFKQVAFVDAPEAVAGCVKAFARDALLRSKLQSWESSSAVGLIPADELTPS